MVYKYFISLIVQTKLLAKEVEINLLNDVITELRPKQNEVKTENEMLKRRTEEIRESSKVSS